MLLFSFLLLQFKLAFGFCFFLFFALHLSLGFELLLLQLERLLRLCADSGLLHLLPHLTLHALWIALFLTHDGLHCRREHKVTVVPEYKLVHLLLPRLCAEGHFCDRELFALNAFKNTDVEWLLKGIP